MKLRWSVVLRGAGVLAFVGGSTSCDAPAVDWRGETWVSIANGVLQLDSAGHVSWAAELPAPAALPADTSRCMASTRFGWQGSRALYAIWWSLRHDGTAALLASFSADGGRTWKPPAVVDTSDTRDGERGCGRLPPSVAADGANVHVAYSMMTGQIAGIYYAHSMDHASLFHSPVPIVFGSRSSAAAVSGAGDRVVVAYEDPSTSQPQISLAISGTMGHIFEHRVQVSSGAGVATAPQVAVAGDEVVVAWTQRAAMDSTRALLVVRSGRLR